MTRMSRLLERLEQGPVICAEGYLFELERRGYLQAGAFVPEVVLDHPELVAQLHREFVHAGSDVVEAFTYYAHREKLQTIDKEHLLEPMNREALAIAKGVADETDSLLAGDICNTNVYVSGDSESSVRRMFKEQVGWAVEAGVDFVIGETFTWCEEALVALDVIKATGLPAVITMTIHREGTTGDETDVGGARSGYYHPDRRASGGRRARPSRYRPPGSPFRRPGTAAGHRARAAAGRVSPGGPYRHGRPALGRCAPSACGYGPRTR